MLKIEIDEEVFAYLQSRAVAFVEKPNDTLRRIFSLNKTKSMYTGTNAKISIKRKKRKTSFLPRFDAYSSTLTGSATLMSW